MLAKNYKFNQRIPVQAREIVLDKYIPWNVYNKQGQLLLRKGMQLHSEVQRERLSAFTLFRSLGTALRDNGELHDVVSPFKELYETAERLRHLYSTMIHTVVSPADNVADEIYQVANKIIEIYRLDNDATLGALLVDHRYLYTIVHPIHTSILIYMMASRLHWSMDEIIHIIVANLLSNIGMLEMQEDLMDEDYPLARERLHAIKKHPVRSTVLMKQAGFRDKLLLEMVMQHHEQMDGKGYPRGLAGQTILRQARLIALADRYHAMLSSRFHRRGLSAADALRRIFNTHGKLLDEELAMELILELGMFPAGSYVKLKNKETAIVIRRNLKDSGKPLVKTILNSRRQRDFKLTMRDTKDFRYEIDSLCRPVKVKLDIYQLWDYA